MGIFDPAARAGADRVTAGDNLSCGLEYDPQRDDGVWWTTVDEFHLGLSGGGLKSMKYGEGASLNGSGLRGMGEDVLRGDEDAAPFKWR